MAKKAAAAHIAAAVPRRPALARFDAAPTRAEYRAAVDRLKCRKAAGDDGVRGEVPAAWRDAVMIPLPKKGDLRLCDSWRGISLLSVPGKVLARIVASRLTEIAEGVLAESATGFRRGRGTTDCVAVARALIDAAAESADGTLHCVFIDLRKAFDLVHRRGLWLTLERQGVPPRLLAAARAFHDGMQAKVRVDGALSEPFPVREGCRQGCLIAPVLLNLFYAAVLDEWRRQAPPDIEVRFALDGGFPHHRTDRRFRAEDRAAVGDAVYADDTSLFAASWETAKRRFHRYADVVGRFGLVVSFPKTKHMVVGRDDTGGFPLATTEAHQDRLGPYVSVERVERFPLLGSVVQSDGGVGVEVAARLRAAGEAWARMRPTCFATRLISPARKYRIFATFVLSRLLSGAETWRAWQRDLQPLRVFYNRCLRRLAGVNLWMMAERGMTDADVRRRCRAPHFDELVDRDLLRWTGHCLRMSAERLPLQLLLGDVPQWPAAASRPRGGRYQRRANRALRRFGVEPALFADAAQD
eukprot:gene9084-3526_t